MRINFTNGKLIVRFTLNFIIHQILLFLFASLPAVFYITVLKQPSTPVIIHLTTGLIFAAYLLYCLFYGYYVARPMADILMRIKRLSSGEYLMPVQKKRYRSFSSRLYREVYANLDSLSYVLQENEQKRAEFEQQRQDWAAGATHDLKTPLSYISGYADMLLSDAHEWSADEKREFLQLIKDKAVHMEALISDIGIAFRMDQSLDTKVALQEIEVVEFVRRMVAEAANLPAAKEYQFDFSGEEAAIYAEGDGDLLKRAFLNLLVNAVVHNPAGTKISVQVQCGEHIEIRVSDNGRGMDEQSVNHLFDRYYRGTSTDIPAGGTGLGMAIVKQIITRHHGTVTVESKVGEGTTIAVQLPLNAARENLHDAL